MAWVHSRLIVVTGGGAWFNDGAGKNGNQYAHHERQVLDELAKNLQLREALEKATEASEKLTALTAFSISISYLLNIHPCRQRVADQLRNKGRRAATPCRQR